MFLVICGEKKKEICPSITIPTVSLIGLFLSFSPPPRLDHGLLQHQEFSPAGAEEADEQDGHQEHGQPLHRRHQQRGAGRPVPRHQGVHAQPQRVPEGHQEPDQDGGEAGSALQKQPVQRRGADPGGELQVGGESHAGAFNTEHEPGSN